MTKFLKRSGAALLSLVLLCVLAIGAGAAASQTVGVKFWKERSDKEAMANTGVDSDRTATLTRQANGTYTPDPAGEAGVQDGRHRLAVRPDHRRCDLRRHPDRRF